MTKDIIKTFYTLRKPLLRILLGGIVLCMGLWYAERKEALERFSLDLFGKTVEGTFDARPDAHGYRIRYVDPTGAIYARIFDDWLGPQALWQTTDKLYLRFDKDNPRRFQPAGVSLVPGLICFVLLGVGIWLISSGRRRALDSVRRRVPENKMMKDISGERVS